MPAASARLTGELLAAVSFYQRMPLGMEMPFAAAYSFGGDSAAKLVHFAFLLGSIPLILLVGEKLGASPVQAAIAAALYFCTPVVGISGTSAYIDAALVFYTLATIALMLDWKRTGAQWLLVAAGITGGGWYGLQITGRLFAATAPGFLLLGARRWH